MTGVKEELSGPGASNDGRAHYMVTTLILPLGGSKCVDAQSCGKLDR